MLCLLQERLEEASAKVISRINMGLAGETDTLQDHASRLEEALKELAKRVEAGLTEMGTCALGTSARWSSTPSDTRREHQTTRAFIGAREDLNATTRSITGAARVDLTATTRSLTGTGGSSDSSPMAQTLRSGQISLPGRNLATEPLNKVWERLKEENSRLAERRKRLSERVGRAASTQKGSINSSSVGTPLGTSAGTPLGSSRGPDSVSALEGRLSALSAADASGVSRLAGSLGSLRRPVVSTQPSLSTSDGAISIQPKKVPALSCSFSALSPVATQQTPDTTGASPRVSALQQILQRTEQSAASAMSNKLQAKSGTAPGSGSAIATGLSFQAEWQQLVSRRSASPVSQSVATAPAILAGLTSQKTAPVSQAAIPPVSPVATQGGAGAVTPTAPTGQTQSPSPGPLSINPIVSRVTPQSWQSRGQVSARPALQVSSAAQTRH